MRQWPEGIRLASQMQFRFPQFSPTSLSSIMTNASPEALALMTVNYFFIFITFFITLP
jgi:hypothetical protein